MSNRANAEWRRREDALSQYSEGERMMEEAAQVIADLGGYAATPAQLRKQNAEYLHRLAAIARAGGGPPDVILNIIAGAKL